MQIKQCSKEWSDINFETITSMTMRRQNKALRYLDAKGQRRSGDLDRVVCADRFAEYLHSVKKRGREIKGKRVSVTEFVKDAISLANDPAGTQILNSQWRDAGSTGSELPNMIAMVDTSGSMMCDNCIPFYTAMGLGCRIAERSKVGRRVLTFSESPRWINLDGCPELTDMVRAMKDAGNWGLNTNFTAAMQVILDAICERRLPASEVKDMILVILSDMQIDADGNEPLTVTMQQAIVGMYESAGMRSIGEPYEPPHILFWNLRSTDGFPTLSSVSGCSMMSGVSPALLDAFCQKGVSSLRDTTPWSMLMEVLGQERYNGIV